MARKSGSSGFKIRTVKSKEDRKRPSVFMRLKAEEMFKGYALFEPDPELEDNAWYYEYYDHFDKQGNAYVPCAGERCPFCAANDNPSTRALTVWYFPENDAKDQLKIFTMNYGTLEDISDEAEEEDGIRGKKIRIKRLDDRGNYKIKLLGDKPLTKKQLAELEKRLAELFPNGLEGVVMRQLKIQLERLKAVEDMDDLGDDDDDDDEDAKPKSRRGKEKPKDDDEDDDEDEDDEDEEDEDDDEDEDEDDDESDDDEDEDEDEDEEEDEAVENIEDEEFEILSVSKKKNSIKVEHNGESIELVGDDDTSVEGYKKGDTVTVSAEYDEDEESWGLTAISAVGDDDEDEEEDDAEDEAKSLAGVFEVVKTQEKDEIIEVKTDDGKVQMWVGDGVDVDYDKVKKGVKIDVQCQADDEGDWIITSLKVKKGKK